MSFFVSIVLSNQPSCFDTNKHTTFYLSVYLKLEFTKSYAELLLEKTFSLNGVMTSACWLFLAWHNLNMQSDLNIFYLIFFPLPVLYCCFLLEISVFSMAQSWFRSQQDWLSCKEILPIYSLCLFLLYSFNTNLTYSSNYFDIHMFSN